MGRRFLYFPCSCRFCLQKLFQSLKLLLPTLFLFHLPCKEPGSVHQFHPLSGLLPGGQKPVQIAGRTGPPEEGKQPLCISPFCEGAVVLFPHCRLFHLLLQLLRPLRLQTSGEDQLLLSAGHGHVQHAQFLSQAVPLQLSGHHVLFQGPPLHSQDAVHIVQADSKVHIHNDRLCDVLHVEPFAQAGNEADGKFQPLGTVDAHDAHRVRIFILQAGFSIVDVIFFHLLHVTDEVEQAEITGLFKALRFGKEHFQIGTALLSAGQGGRRIQIAGLLQEFPDQLMDGQVNGIIPKPLQKGQKRLRFGAQLCFFRFFPCLLPFLHAGAQAFIQPALFLLRPDQGDLPVGEARRWAFQHAEQRDILQRVVQHPQEIQYGLHLRRCKISGS